MEPSTTLSNFQTFVLSEKNKWNASKLTHFTGPVATQCEECFNTRTPPRSVGITGSEDDNSAAQPSSGRVALPESDPELTAMPFWAAESIGLHWRPPPSPERSRLDDWFLGQPPPVPFFLEVHEEVTRSWKEPFSARNRPCKRLFKRCKCFI